MLEIKNISKSYKQGGIFSKGRQQILTNVTFNCYKGECLGIIGESGSGKSTLGRLILGIEKPDSGTITFDGRNVQDKSARLGNISAVFQDYTSSINPFFTVEEAIIESLKIQKNSKNIDEIKIDELLNQVGLNASYKNKYSHELSGGEVQRVCIARAISNKPKYILLDEAISSLDVSVQIQILNLLKEIKKSYNVSYIFVTHDIQAAAYICDRVIIFRNGKIEEIVKIENLKNVQSEYAKKLLRSLIVF